MADLLELYYNNALSDLEDALLAIFFQKAPPPLEQLLRLLDLSDNPKLIHLCLEILYLNRSQLFDALVDIYESDPSEELQYWLLVVMCTKPSFSSMHFVISEYMRREESRPLIRSLAFEDKPKLLLGLAAYVEQRPLLSEAEEQAVKDILKLIPRRVILGASSQLNFLKLSDYYYSIDPTELPED